MKKALLFGTLILLSGCSYYQQYVDKMQTDTLEYVCQQQTLNVERRANSQQLSLIYDNQRLQLDKGRSAIGERYTDGVYMLWMKTPETAELYKKDTIVVGDCQLTADD